MLFNPLNYCDRPKSIYGLFALKMHAFRDHPCFGFGSSYHSVMKVALQYDLRIVSPIDLHYICLTIIKTCSSLSAYSSESGYATETTWLA